ncbi:MAG: hypothetical protein NUV74_00435 [Candidatus Brocadiaceae bacterium]|nr:hypothetical protein [Candidatus Brocadiaceae bacterium]
MSAEDVKEVSILDITDQLNFAKDKLNILRIISWDTWDNHSLDEHWNGFGLILGEVCDSLEEIYEDLNAYIGCDKTKDGE